MPTPMSRATANPPEKYQIERLEPLACAGAAQEFACGCDCGAAGACDCHGVACGCGALPEGVSHGGMALDSSTSGSAIGNGGSAARERPGDGSVPMLAPGVSVPLASAGCAGAVSSSEVRLPSRDFVIRPGATGGGAAAASRGAGKPIAAERGRTGSGV